MTTKTFQAISPPFACGISWLLNILLELNIKTTNYAHKDNHWIPEPNTISKYTLSNYAYERLKWYIPNVVHKTQFNFLEPIEVIWDHRIDFARNLNFPTILFVRDPRDAIHSLYKRDYENQLSFVEFLATPNRWPHHFPDMFDLNPVETMALFCRFWIEMGKIMPVLIVRLEDTRINPHKEINRILNFIGVSRSITSIDKAIDASTFTKARLSNQTLIKATNHQFTTARHGKIGEWQDIFTKEYLKFFETSSMYDLLVILKYATTKPKTNNIATQILSYLFATFYKKNIQYKSDFWNHLIFSDTLQTDKLKHISLFFYKYLSKYSLVKSIKPIVMGLNINSEPPKLLFSINNINFINYHNYYFAIPQSLGPVDISKPHKLLKKKHSSILISKNITLLKIKLQLSTYLIKIKTIKQIAN